jgi:hypothetical protein
MNNYNDACTTAAFPFLLDGQAKLCNSMIVETVKNELVQLETSFKTPFPDLEKNKANIKVIKQNPGETAEECVTPVEYTFKGLNLPIWYQLEQAIEGLNPTLLPQVKFTKPADFEWLKEVAKRAGDAVTATPTHAVDTQLVALSESLSEFTSKLEGQLSDMMGLQHV